MRFYFNLPGRVTKVKIVLTEEKYGELVQEKSYNFTKEQFKAFSNDHQRAAYINALVGADWMNPDDVRKSKKEMRAKREEHKAKKIERMDPEQAEFSEYMNAPTGEEGGNK